MGAIGFTPHAHHQAHYPHYARVAHHWRPAHYAHRAYRASPRYASVAPGAIPGSPAFSALVVDANSGRTLYSADENGLRHPASITKVMTLYLLFEELDRGAMTLRTQIPISEHAAAQEPSKLGLAARRHDQRRRRDQGRRDPFGQRHRGRDRRGRRRLGKQFRRHDDAQGACAGHDQHGLRQRLRTPQRPTDHHGARSDDPRALARGALPPLLPLFLDRPIRLRRRDHRQSQPSARPRRRRRRNQDRLHESVRLQSLDLGPSRRTVADRRRHGRALRRGARPDHGKSDRRPHRGSVDRPYRDRSRRRFVCGDDRAARDARRRSARAPRQIAEAKLERVSATTRAANAAGEGDDGTGDEEAADAGASAQGACARSARRAADHGRSRFRQRSRRRENVSQESGPARCGERAGHAARPSREFGRGRAPSGAGLCSKTRRPTTPPGAAG